MTKFDGTGLVTPLFVLTLCIAFSRCAYGQQTYVDQEARVSDLPMLTARTHDAADVLATSLEMVVHDPGVCCGKDSALEDSVERADPAALKDVAARLQGRHLLSDGRPIAVSAEFWSPEAVSAGKLANVLNSGHALLMMWNSRIYVLYGVVYRWVDSSPDAGPYTILRKMLLLDTRFADERREVEFNRETDDPAKLQGFLFVTFTAQ